MAKSKKGKKKHHKRVGAVNPDSPLVILGAVAAGYFGDQFLGVNAMIDKMLPGTVVTPATATTKEIVTPTTTMSNVAMAGELGIGGYLLLSKSTKPTTKWVKHIAGGVAAGLGLRRLLKEMKVVTGYQTTPVLGRTHRRRGVHGFHEVPVLGGVPPQLSGVPPQLAGYAMGAYTPSGSGVMGGVGTGLMN